MKRDIAKDERWVSCLTTNEHFGVGTKDSRKVICTSDDPEGVSRVVDDHNNLLTRCESLESDVARVEVERDRLRKALGVAVEDREECPPDYVHPDCPDAEGRHVEWPHETCEECWIESWVREYDRRHPKEAKQG